MGESAVEEKSWSAEWSEEATKQLAKIKRKNPQMARDLEIMLDAAAESGNPRSRGKGLKGNLAGKWRYRLDDYRVICEIKESILLVLAVKVGLRSEIYKDKK